MIVLCVAFFTNSITFVAKSTREYGETQIAQGEVISSDIIGRAESVCDIQIQLGINESEITTYDNTNDISNLISLDWVATESGIYLYVTNNGLDPIDSLSGYVSTGNLKEPFSYSKIFFGTHIYYIDAPVKTCTESIRVYFSASDGKSKGSTTSYGSRAISKTLVNLWSSGSFGSKEACINYHFKKHGSEVSTKNIAAYVRLADANRDIIISKDAKYIRKVNGAIANVYRYEILTYYLHVVVNNGQPTGDLVSFGLAW